MDVFELARYGAYGFIGGIGLTWLLLVLLVIYNFQKRLKDDVGLKKAIKVFPDYISQYYDYTVTVKASIGIGLILATLVMTGIIFYLGVAEIIQNTTW